MSPGLSRTLALLEQVPDDRRVSLLLRHAARRREVELPGPDEALTEAGRGAARRLGRALRGRLLAVHTSPLLRCRATAEALISASGRALRSAHDRLLGGPGAFVVDEEVAGRSWEREGHAAVLAHLCAGQGRLPGLADPRAAARELLLRLRPKPGAEAGLVIFVTHDAVLGPALHRWSAPERPRWPDFLDAAAIWSEASGPVLLYDGARRELGPALHRGQ